jgi:predicted small metal-binding protein
MKTLHCKDVGFDCPGIIQADSEAEVLQLAAQHALDAHQTTVTPEMAEQIIPLIHEE